MNSEAERLHRERAAEKAQLGLHAQRLQALKGLKLRTVIKVDFSQLEPRKSAS